MAELNEKYIKMLSDIDKHILELEEKQEKLTNTVLKMRETLNLIKSDIYEDDDGNYDFEIVCPYCNHEFLADIDDDLNDEIECPECHNIIELDWNDEENCEECHKEGCSSQCANIEIHKQENNQDNSNNDDDM